MTQHTPGPWRVYWMPQSTTAEIETVAQEPGKYAHITNDLPMAAGYGADAAEVEYIEGRNGLKVRYSARACADARLMAAGPEMLAALQRAAEFFDVFEEVSEQAFGNWGEVRREILAAIAKATEVEVAK